MISDKQISPIITGLQQSQTTDFVSITPIEIEFGVFGKDCQNFGICKIVRMPQTNNNFISTRPCRHGRGYLFCLSNQTIQLSVFRASMRPCTFQKYFAKGQFIIEEDYQLAATLCPKGKNTSYFIPKGNYKAMKNAQFVQINFRLRVAFSVSLTKPIEVRGYPNAQSP